MNDRTLIFRSVMSELLEPFSPLFDDFIKSFHTQYAMKNHIDNTNISDSSNQENASIDTKFFDDIFEHFPRDVPLYKEIIKKLCALASSDVDGSIHFLTKLIKESINGKPTKQFTLLQMAKTFPDLNDKVNYLLFFYLSNIFFTDLICQIMANYYAKKTIKSNTNNINSSNDSDTKQINPNVVTFLTRTAYSVASSKHALPNTSILILSQWSVILSLLSEYDFNSVTQIFSMFLNSNDITNALVLMQYVRFDMHDAFGGVFFESIIQQVRSHIRKKTITNSGLEALSKMIVTIPFNEELFTRLYQLVRPLRKDKNLRHLWPGSVILSCSLFLRLPTKRNRSKFLQKQVVFSCSDTKKLETSLKCFSMVIIGRNTDVFWENWEWGPNPRSHKYTYLHLNSACEMSQDDPRSFTSIFMTNYFTKSEFYLYPKIVKHILLHLASLDFAYFTSFVVPQFVELEDDDPRLVALLKIVPKVNQPIFWEHSFKKISNKEEQLKKFNKSLHQKVLNILKLCLSKLPNSGSNRKSNSMLELSEDVNNNHCICFFERDIMIESLLSEADQKISSILDEWKMNKYFVPTRIRFRLSDFPNDKYSMIDSLFPTLKIILDENDFNNTTMMDIFISCSYLNDIIVAKTSYDISKNVIPKLSNFESFLQMLIVTISTNEDFESVYTCLSIIESILNSNSNSNNLFFIDLNEINSNNVENDCKISKKLLFDIEVISFLCLASEHPAIRRLALAVLTSVNNNLKNHGLFSYLKDNFGRIEKDAKEHILIYNAYANYSFNHDSFISNSTTKIEFKTAILSYYYDVWMFFISAMINLLIEVNYQPFFKHVKNIIPSISSFALEFRNLRKSDTSAIIIILSSMFYVKSIINSDRYTNDKAYYNNQYAKYSNSTKDERNKICAFLTKLLNDELDENYSELAFEIIPHLHFSILGPIIDILSNVPQKKLPKSLRTLSLILKYPEIDKYFINHNSKRIITFINTINTYLLENQLNTPRIMEWTKNQIKLLLSNVFLAFDYCSIISSTFKVCTEFNYNCWPISTREIVFRFLVNWSITAYNITENEINQIINNNEIDSSKIFKYLRNCAKIAIVQLSKVGPMFTHSPLFDDVAVHFLGSIEISGMKILSNILNYHFDIIFDDYVKACYLQPSSISEVFFDAIVNNVIKEHSNSIINKSGDLLLLAMVYGQREHTRSHELIDRFLNIAIDKDLVKFPKDQKDNNIINNIVNGIFSTINNFTNISFLLPNNKNSNSTNLDLVKNDILNSAYLILVPQIFTFLAEAVFKAFFYIVEEYKIMSIPFKEVINAARIWTSVIRFLPKQHTCVQVFVPSKFNHFTPYQFLTSLTHVTESIGEDKSKLLICLWEDLLKAPDHRSIIPIYLSNMINSKSLQSIFSKLLDFFPDAVIPFIDERCSFAYFFHCTKCLKEDFTLSSASWSASFLCHVFENNFDKILPRLPTILHFIIIFRERGLDSPFRLICKILGVECPEGNFNYPQLRILINQIVNKLISFDKFSIERWGNECLKWLFACDDIHLASISFLVYNSINKPYDLNIFHFQVIHTVSYHIGKIASLQEKQNIHDYYIKQEEESSISNINSNFNSLILDLALLIDESFIFFSNHFDGNDILVYNYISSFLDSQILPYLELFGAIKFFIQAFKQPEILILVCQNIITLIRPLIPIIEKDKNVQELIDKCVEKIDNEDVKMIVTPIKRAHLNLFPHLEPYEVLIKKVSLNALCNALVHYAVLAESSSRSVLNYIFDISTTIIQKVSDDNNINPLTRLYQAALRSLNKCPFAFSFIQEVCARQPQVASNEIIESFVWTRSMDDINRSIKLVLVKMRSGSFNNLFDNDNQNLSINNVDIEFSSDYNYSDTSSRDKENDFDLNSSKSIQGFSSRLTDCHSYKSVLNFLFLSDEEEDEEIILSATSSGNILSNKYLDKKRSSTLPRILPFATQKEMIEGMKKVKTTFIKNSDLHISLTQNQSSLTNDDSLVDIPNSTSIIFNSMSQSIPSGRRKSKSARNYNNTDSDDSFTSDSGSECFENDDEIICQPNFASIYGSLIQFPTLSSSVQNITNEPSFLNGLSPLRHPKKLMLQLSQSKLNDSDKNSLYDKNILEDEIDRSRLSAMDTNMTPIEFFRDCIVRRRSSSSASTT